MFNATFEIRSDRELTLFTQFLSIIDGWRNGTIVTPPPVQPPIDTPVTTPPTDTPVTTPPAHTPTPPAVDTPPTTTPPAVTTPPVELATESGEAVTTETGDSLTVDDVTLVRAFRSYAEGKGVQELTSLLGEYGAKRVMDIAPEKRGAFIAQITKAVQI